MLIEFIRESQCLMIACFGIYQSYVFSGWGLLVHEGWLGYTISHFDCHEDCIG